MDTTVNRVTIGTRHNPLTFYIRVLLYMFVALLVRVVMLLPLVAALKWMPVGSPFRWLAVLTPLMLIFFVLPLRFSFAQALVQPARERHFSLDKATALSDYGTKLGEGLVHALNILKWAVPLLLMLGACRYVFLKIDIITLMKSLSAIGAGVVGFLYAVANFFIGIFGGTQLVADGGLMQGIFTVGAVLGLGLLILVWGMVRNSAFRYIWAQARQNGQRPRAEARRRLTGRRWMQLGVSLCNLILLVPAAIVVFTTLKGVLGDVSKLLLTYLTTQKLNLPEMTSAIGPLLFAFFLCYMPLLPVRRILTAYFATKPLRRAVEAPQDARDVAAEQPASEPAPTATPIFASVAAPVTAPVYTPDAEAPAAVAEEPAPAYQTPAAWPSRYSAEPAEESEPEPATEPEPAPVYNAESEPVAEPEPIAEPEPAPVYQAEPEPVAEPEPIAEPEPVAEPELVAEPEPEPVAQPEPAPAYTAEPEPVAEPEPINPFAAQPFATQEPEPVAAVPGNPYAAEPQPTAPLFPFAQEPSADEDDYEKPVAPPTIDTSDTEDEDNAGRNETDR